MVTPSSMRWKSSVTSHSRLNSSQPTTMASAANSVSGQMDAIQLRDELVHLKKEMNALKKEKDIAKAQQVFHNYLTVYN